MRLDRYLSSVTALSRSQAQRAIRAGRVRVDGVPVRRPDQDCPLHASVELDGRPLERPGHRYFMLHKPKGYVCSSADMHNSTVLELLHEPVLSGLHFAGRLDKDATGLVLITDDGAWSHQLVAPNRNCPKTYRVDLAEPLRAEAADGLRRGVLLRGEMQPTRPAILEMLSPSCIRLTIYEGRYHQVKRMLAAVGNRVVGLHRERIAALTLDANLQPGQYRALSRTEILSVAPPTGTT
ncbi:MAG: 16S rRNA pseudouridine(516) synthase RsuA [Chromatiales bacterium]|jgi:16S rRNA pseudouridine516 synthase